MNEPGRRFARGVVRAVGALAVALLVIAGAEFALRLAGIGEPLRDRAAQLGFDPNAKYFEPDPNVPGGWVTRIRDEAAREKHFPPRGNRTRVVLFGASNVQSFGHGWLQSALNEEHAGRTYEVLNLGRAGYGSTRVLLLYRQAIEILKPDVAVFYLGDNEFVEDVFRTAVDEREPTTVVERAAAFVRGTHVGTVLTGPPPEPDGDEAAKPEPIDFVEPDHFKTLTYDQTLERYAHLGTNLREMCRLAIERDIRVVVSTVIYNRFAPPHVAPTPAEFSEPERERFEKLRLKAQGRIPDRLRPLFPRRFERIRVYDWTVGPGTDLGGAPIPGLRACRPPLDEVDAEIPDPSTWGPKILPLYRALDVLFARDFDELEVRELKFIERQCRDALELHPRHARALFDLGIVSIALGKSDDEIVRCLQQAADFDHAPRKSNERINALIRTVAGEFPAVSLFDADRVFADRMPLGLTGWDWMRDHCHLHRGACQVLMRDLARHIVATWP